MYHAYPPHSNSSDRKAIIHLTDIFGVPLLENKLYNPLTRPSHTAKLTTTPAASPTRSPPTATQ